MTAAALSPPPPRQLSLEGLKAVSVLGRGAKGVVFHVVPAEAEEADEGGAMALKAVSREAARQKKKPASAGGGEEADGHRRIWFERDVLLSLRHPLLPSLRGVLATDAVVGFAIDRCGGGDLNSLRRRQTEKMFSDSVIRKQALCFPFRAGSGAKAAAAPAADSLSPPSTSRTASSSSSSSSSTATTASAGARTPAKSNSFVGTEDYVAPEIIAGRGHDFAVDWWGLGVVLYEMLYGRTPFRGQNRKETFYRVLTKQPELVGEQTPLRDLIARLLEKDPDKRVGARAVKAHPFFRGVDWDRILHVARPPFIPTLPQDEDADEALDVEKVVREVFASNDAEAATAADGQKASPEADGGRGDVDGVGKRRDPSSKEDGDFSVFF
ncbi:hypothetical protein EJB05_38992 [Eragrostis curvula]|uniref:non-specific serine/threonine protein kinase n=1 Tax=Eragrostis curvula TaxID=38414 RepID=A0A5J9TVN6_9POAL|nr:hypothetical protein EJB05_38992 [Eragrostis curvula]